MIGIKDLFWSLPNYMQIAEKYRISTALMMEKPVRRPMVPPIDDNIFKFCCPVFSDSVKFWGVEVYSHKP